MRQTDLVVAFCVHNYVLRKKNKYLNNIKWRKKKHRSEIHKCLYIGYYGNFRRLLTPKIYKLEQEVWLTLSPKSHDAHPTF